MKTRTIGFMIAIAFLVLLGVGILWFIQDHTKPMYSCEVCLEGRCAHSTIEFEQDSDAIEEAKGKLCYPLPGMQANDCLNHPSSDYKINCPPPKKKFVLRWFAFH